jgi:hypothetical protein
MTYRVNIETIIVTTFESGVNLKTLSIYPLSYKGKRILVPTYPKI